MHLFYHAFPMYHVHPSHYAPTFVAATNTSAMTPMSAPSTPLTTAQQLQNILSGSIYGTPTTTEVVPRFGSPLEAAQALQATRRQQWSAMMGGLGAGAITTKEEQQQRLMERERNIMGQLRQMGFPVSPMTFK